MLLTRRDLNLLLLAGLGGTLGMPFAHGQAGWPSKPVRIIVPYTPGGFTDNVARIVAQKLQEQLGKPIPIENKPGANSIIGVEALARSPADGHTFGVVIAAFAANTTLYPKLPYDPAKDLQPVSLICDSPLIAAVNNDAPFKTASELIAYARANPGKVNFGSSGSGAAGHLTAELLKSVAKVDMTHVPYKGAAPALTDLMGGQIQLLFDAASGLISQGKAGKVRLIGVASDRRLPVVPDVPTFIEQGIPEFTGATWAGMLAPAGAPKEIVQRMAQEVARIAQMEDVKERFEQMGIFSVGSTPEEFERFLAAETAKWGKVIREANVQPES